MSQTLMHLSNNAIRTLTEPNTESQQIFVQVIEFQPKKDKHYLLLSDGSFTIKALPSDQNILNPQTDVNSIICIKRHLMGKKNVIGILEFEKVFNYKAKIGNPQQFTIDSINPENIESFKLEKSMIDLKLSSKSSDDKTNLKQQQMPLQKQLTAKKSLIQQKSQHRPQTEKKFQLNVVPAQPLNGNLKDYQTIKNLCIGFERWTIVCRIVKLDYNEFISKQGKDMKVLNLQLMDRTGMKIAGAFFGDAAKQFNQYLIKDRVYKISQAQVRQQSYNNSKNQKLSPYKLIFTGLSKFEEVSDTLSIAKNEDSAIKLGECIDKRIIGQQFDVICILVNVEETIDVKKDQKPLKKTNLLIADPQKTITIHATVWNENLIPGNQLIGKTIILTRFKLGQYKGSLTLGSTYKSGIILAESHQYKKFQSQVMKQYASYEKLYEIKVTGGDNNLVCTTLKDLNEKIDNLRYDEWARGDFTVSINRFGLKKWHFDGCPYCGKAAEPLNNCPSCHQYVQKTISHFIMAVQVCDSTGSLWTTAYDQLARKIFGVTDQSQVIDYLLKLDANQLKQQTESYLYQQFKLRISSKKDNEGRIKHHVSKIYERNFGEETLKNVQLINKLLIV